MAVWHKGDSVKEAKKENQEKLQKEQTLQIVEQAITDLELDNIERDIAITDLELEVLELKRKGE